jgi:iron complex transport system ATP-binding protein
MGRAPRIGLFQKPRAEDEAAAFGALRALSIDHLAENPYTEISGGERQQATIARALAQQPQAILFDEPTAHLDYGNQHRILRLIRSLADQGYGIVITTHNPDHALLLGGRAAILDREGSLNVGDSEEIITEARLKTVYNTELRLLHIKELSRVACLPLSLSEGEKADVLRVL